MDAVIGNIKSLLRSGHGVKLARFGSFKPVVRKERRGINPRTGTRIEIRRGVAVKFKAFKGILFS